MNTTSRPDPLAAAMERLTEPAAPSTLETTVMARIARLPAPAQDTATAPEPVGARRDVFAWVLGVAGLALVAGLSAYSWLQPGALSYLGAVRIVGGGSTWMSDSGVNSAMMALGLLLYAAGLFSQVGRRGPTGAERRL